MECQICQTDLGVLNYEPGLTEDIDVSDSVFRLKCGHAFHTSCVCRSLRRTAACPVCRSGTSSVGEIFVEDGNLMFTWNGTEDETGTVENVVEGNSDAVVAILNLSDKDQRTQKQRAAVNRAIRRYRVHEIQTKRYRRTLIREALDALRDRFRNEHDKHLRSVRRELAKLRRTEAAVVGPANMVTLEQSFPNRFEAEIHLGATLDDFGPLKHRFWHHS